MRTRRFVKIAPRFYWSEMVPPLPFRGGAAGGALPQARRSWRGPTPTPPLKGRGSRYVSRQQRILLGLLDLGGLARPHFGV